MKSFLLLCCTATLVSSAAADGPTILEQRLTVARAALAAKPSPAGYDEVASMLVRRARETGNNAFCGEASDAVERSLQISPDAQAGRKVRVLVRLCQKRWSEALDEAVALNKKNPDDVMLWGLVAEARMALGDYAEAETDVQTMLNLRQVNPLGLERGAQLREALGYNDPAIEWWNSALRLTSASDPEQRAWILTRIAEVQRLVGRYELAQGAALQALELVPNYPIAMDELALTLMAQKKFGEAVDAARARLKIAPSTAATYTLASALAGAGRTDEASQTFQSFEKQALAQSGQPDNANLELVHYYCGPGKNAAEALRIAKLNLTRQKDESSLQAYGTALAAQGDYKQASAQMALALKPGVRNPEWLYEAGKIAQKAGDAAAAHQYFQQALEAAPASPTATQVIQELAGTAKQGS